LSARRLAVSRLAWFVGLWLAGVASVGLLGYLIGLVLQSPAKG
jgi:hypothetical protein